MAETSIALDAPVRPLRDGRFDRVQEFDVAWELRALLGDSAATGGRFLLYDRNLAHTLLDLLKPVIKCLPLGDVLLLRLDHVRATAEFAEEMVRNLVCGDEPHTRLIKEKIVVLVNPDEGTSLALHQALDEERDAAMVLETAQEPWTLEYIGKLQPHLLSILKFVRSRRGTTSKDIAEEFNFQLADASRRLKELYEDGLIRRAATVSHENKLTYSYTYFHPNLEYQPDLPVDQLPFRVLQEIRQTRLHSRAP